MSDRNSFQDVKQHQDEDADADGEIVTDELPLHALCWS